MHYIFTLEKSFLFSWIGLNYQKILQIIKILYFC